jgi:hypothetical protein
MKRRLHSALWRDMAILRLRGSQTQGCKGFIDERRLTFLSSIWRSSLILAFASCYLMWGTILSVKNNELRLMSVAITLLAQLNPLVEPRRGDWRPDYIPSD